MGFPFKVVLILFRHLITATHNYFRSRVEPPAADMLRMVKLKEQTCCFIRFTCCLNTYSLSIHIKTIKTRTNCPKTAIYKEKDADRKKHIQTNRSTQKTEEQRNEKQEKNRQTDNQPGRKAAKQINIRCADKR